MFVVVVVVKWNTCVMETVKYWIKKLMKKISILEHGETFHAHRLAEWILWNCYKTIKALQIQKNSYKNSNDSLHI